jgi:hypothetical protein
MSRIVDTHDLDWGALRDFQYIPESGLHVLFWPAFTVATDEHIVELSVLDVSADDAAVVIAMAALLSGENDVPPLPDELDRPYHSVSIFHGRRMRWQKWISVAAARALDDYFRNAELQREVLGTDALRWFESDQAREAREREAQVVAALWQEAGEVEA